MRVLLDECVPRALRGDIPGHEVRTVAEMGWAGVKNGELLRRAASELMYLLRLIAISNISKTFRRPFDCGDHLACAEQRHRDIAFADARSACGHSSDQTG
jgi:hypothetical protein